MKAFVLGLGLSFAACGRPPEPQPSAAIDVRFRIPLHVAVNSTQSPFQDVQLVLEGGSMLVVATGARVPTQGRNDLDIRGFQLP
jgi:hypothetical protein